LDLSVNASSSVDFEFSKDQTKSTYMTILPSGSSPSADTDGTITLTIAPAGVGNVGYEITIFSITGLTKVHELP
jgi:hypothetical protein